jgi:hypothetical protein
MRPQFRVRPVRSCGLFVTFDALRQPIETLRALIEARGAASSAGNQRLARYLEQRAGRDRKR